MLTMTLNLANKSVEVNVYADPKDQKSALWVHASAMVSDITAYQTQLQAIEADKRYSQDFKGEQRLKATKEVVEKVLNYFAEMEKIVLGKIGQQQAKDPGDSDYAKRLYVLTRITQEIEGLDDQQMIDFFKESTKEDVDFRVELYRVLSLKFKRTRELAFLDLLDRACETVLPDNFHNHEHMKLVNKRYGKLEAIKGQVLHVVREEIGEEIDTGSGLNYKKLLDACYKELMQLVPAA